MLSGMDYVLLSMMLVIISALCWVMWLYILTYRQLTASNRDRDRLIRRIGLYHSLPLTTPSDTPHTYPPETPIPPAFRMRRPQPPMGYHSNHGPTKGDL